jgi:hypothetical protein
VFQTANLLVYFFQTKYFVLFDDNSVFLSLFGIFFDSYVVFVDFVFYLCKNIDQGKPPLAPPKGREKREA